MDLGIEKAIETGVLPFDYSWESFDKPTGKFLAVRPSHSVVTVSLTRTPTKQPRTVVFRQQQKQVNSQLDLLDGVTEPMEITGLPHILLLHDYRDPEFAHLGIPRADCDQDFSYRTENLFKLPHEVEPQGPAPEGPDDAELDAVFQLKEDIDRWRKENGNS
ncbi:hypothetical protein D1231_10900 [Henriciella mobilis]|nr:hypothetical protein D1231_10900 [Henriciella mobilis]